MAPLGLGIVGCGNISGRYIGHAAMFPEVRVVACADMVDAVAGQCAAEFGFRHESVESLLTADDVSMVINLTVPEAHYDVSLSALSAGKHVYSEKPLAATFAEGRRLVDEARRLGLRLGVAPDTFLGAAGQTARSAVDAGRIGRIVGGSCHVMSRGAESWHPNPDFFYKRGGGPMLDLGPYYISMLVNLMGPVAKVSAVAATPFATRTIGSEPRKGEKISVETPTTIHSQLQFENGALVTFGASWDVWRHGHNNIEVYGESGSMLVPDPNFFGGEVGVTEEDGPFQAVADGGHPFGKGNRETRRGLVADYRMAGVADMAAALAAGTPHRCAGELGLHVLEVLEGILQSAQDAETVVMETRCERPAALLADDAHVLMGKAAPASDTTEDRIKTSPRVGT